jgi:hypothetical protein
VSLQEEVLLSICMGLAICNLLASLRTDNAQDYVYVSYFLICELLAVMVLQWKLPLAAAAAAAAQDYVSVLLPHL